MMSKRILLETDMLVFTKVNHLIDLNYKGRRAYRKLLNYELSICLVLVRGPILC